MSPWIGIISPIVTGAAGWLVGRGKYRAERKSIELDNFKRSLEIYDKLFSDMQVRIDELSAKCDVLARENENLRKELLISHKENSKLRERLRQFESKLKSLTQK